MGWPPFEPTFDETPGLPRKGEEDPDALLDLLTRPDNEDIDRDLVLRKAIRSRDWLIAQAQLDQGADVNAADEHGRSAMDYAGPEMREKLTAYFSQKHSRRVMAMRRLRRSPAP